VQIAKLQRAGVVFSDDTHHFVIPNVDVLQIGAIDRLIRTAIRG